MGDRVRDQLRKGEIEFNATVLCGSIDKTTLKANVMPIGFGATQSAGNS